MCSGTTRASSDIELVGSGKAVWLWSPGWCGIISVVYPMLQMFSECIPHGRIRIRKRRKFTQYAPRSLIIKHTVKVSSDGVSCRNSALSMLTLDFVWTLATLNGRLVRHSHRKYKIY